MAVMHGHLEVLQLLRAQVPPAPWGVEVCQTAASRGRLDLLQWLRSQTPPCPWDVTTCLAAVEQGQLGRLRWLRVQAPPCQWDVRACLAAVPVSASEMRAWLEEESELLSEGTDIGLDSGDEGYIDKVYIDEEDSVNGYYDGTNLYDIDPDNPYGYGDSTFFC